MHKPTVLLLASSLALSATAAEYTVTSNADDGEGSLRALCTAAVSGDTIYIPGSLGTIALDSVIDLKTPQKSLLLVGVGDTRPVITCNGSHRAFFIGRQSVAHEFRNLIFRDITSADNGAAIYLGDYAPKGLVVSNCLFESCTSPQGAAVRIDRTDTLYNFQDCEFKNNTAASGCALYGGRLQLDRCLFSGNTAASGASCFTLGYGQPSVANDCVFTNNIGKQGCFLAGQNPTNLFNRCLFVGNESTDLGGALCARNPLTLVDCKFIDNLANDGGGAIFRYGGSLEMYNCVFERNRTKGETNWQGGGALFNRDDNAGFCIISNCVFRGNYNLEKNGTGGAVYEYGVKGHTTIVDTLFEGNRALNNSGALKITRSADVRNCTFSENYCSNGVGAVWIGTGDISESCPEAMDPRPVNLENCTFYSNVTDVGRCCVWIDNARNQTYDSVVYDAFDHVSVRHCTFASNVFGADYGALYANNGGVTTSRVDVAATVFRNNTYTDPKTGTVVSLKDISGSIQSANYVVTDQAANGFTIRDPENSANNWFGGTLGDLKFASAMAANDTEKVFLDGTYLPTLAIAPGSPLRDKIPAASVTVAFDARGMERGRLDDFADIGAFEYMPLVSTILLIQ